MQQNRVELMQMSAASENPDKNEPERRGILNYARQGSDPWMTGYAMDEDTQAIINPYYPQANSYLKHYMQQVPYSLPGSTGTSQSPLDVGFRLILQECTELPF